MPIPDYQGVMLPLLKLLGDGHERTMQEVRESLAKALELTEVEQSERLPSGQQTIWSNRVGWAKTYLKYAGLIKNPKRGMVQISPEGQKVLAQHPKELNLAFLKQFSGIREFFQRAATPESPTGETQITAEPTPNEVIGSAYQSLHNATTRDLLDRLKSCSPAFFETIVVKLLVAMGYGGVDGDGSVTGRPGDGGIDGIIKEDKLGLDVVCLQAKRWEAPVGRPVVQGFVGSMDYHRAKKGVILTTSTFTREAQDYVERIEGKKVVLVDGATLAGLLVAHDVGVITTFVYQIKEVSNDFFDEEDL